MKERILQEERAPEILPCAHVRIGNTTGFVTFAGPNYQISDGGRAFYFEWHPYFGPSRVSAKTGDILGQGFFPQSSPFWPLFDRWTAGGKRVDQFGRCILAPAPLPCEDQSPALFALVARAVMQKASAPFRPFDIRDTEY